MKDDDHANTTAPGGNRARSIFVIGTDTEIGKTYVSCLLTRHFAAQGLCVGVYKPAASGFSGEIPDDAKNLIEASGRPWPWPRVCPQAFRTPLAPPLAAEREGRAVDDELLVSGLEWWQDRCDVLVIESAGGALSPISRRQSVLDVAQRVRAPLLLVAGHRLGMINHILLTLEAARRRELEVQAVVVNRHLPEDAELPCRIDESLDLLRSFVVDCPILCVDHCADCWPSTAETIGLR